MAKSKIKPSSNIRGNQAKIVDEFCKTSLEASAAERVKKALRPVILDMITPVCPLTTKEYHLTLTIQENVETLDIEAIRRDMSPEWVKKYTNYGEKKTLKVTKL